MKTKLAAIISLLCVFLAFPVPVSAADPFSLVSPAIGATNVSINPTLSWTGYTGALWYEVTLSDYSDFSIPKWSHNVGSATNPAITPLAYGVTKDETLKYGTTYFWRVRGVTATPYVQGTSIITPAGPWAIGAFTTMTEPTPTPITITAMFGLTSPANGATNVLIKPILSWTAYTGAKWYEVTVSQDPSFAMPDWSHNVYGLSYSVSDKEALKYNITYYWRVRGVTADRMYQVVL